MVLIAVAITLGSLLILSTYRGRLRADLDQSLMLQANDRALLLEQGADPTRLGGLQQDEALVWIGPRGGQAMIESGTIRALANPIPSTLAVVVEMELLVEEVGPDEEDERELASLLLFGAEVSGSDLVVVVGADAETIDEPLADLARIFVIAVPVFVLFAGALFWFVIGRVLSPVERIRQRATEISGDDLSARVPVPETNDEVHALAVTMNDMLGRIESHEQRLRRFSADASHELKSPVANVRAMLDTAGTDDSVEPMLRRRLLGETDRLRDLVDNLLFIATSEEKRAPVREVVQLDEILFAEAELLASSDRVRVDLSGVEPTSIDGDPAQLRRLVRNLADNAARHADSTVSLGVAGADGAVVVTIGDDGDGVPAGERDRIFDRFTRLDEARSRDRGGTGLGLSIVSQIANGHGATVEVGESALGGAAFVVTFPS